MKSVAGSTTLAGGRETGPVATAARVAGGLLLVVVATVFDPITTWDIVAALIVLPLVAAAVAFVVTAALQARAPERLAEGRHALSVRGLVVVGLVIAIATALTFVTPVDAPAIWLFLGVSMLVAAARGHGGCEVVALPNLVFGRQDRGPCVLYGPLDAVEASHRPRPSTGSVDRRQ